MCIHGYVYDRSFICSSSSKTPPKESIIKSAYSECGTCTTGSAVDQVECLKTAIEDVANSIDFIYKFKLNNDIREDLKPLYEKTY